MKKSPGRPLHFTTIDLENWRNFSRVETPLQRHCFLLGPNASGKSNFLVPQGAVPSDPEALTSPKDTMAQIAHGSRRRGIREDIAPRPRSGRRVGPAYSSRLIQFVTDPAQGWRPEIAAQSLGSLERCMRCLNRLTGRAGDQNGR